MLHDPVPEKERPNTGNGHQMSLWHFYLPIFADFTNIFSFSQNKEAFVTAAKDVISSCQSVTQFIRIIANHSLDKQCTVELSLIVEQILTITNQLNIISRSGGFKSCTEN